jgi:23S rRNA pseudouridine2605 synthase
MIRLNRFMAQSGVAARRKCDELITQGKVKVNGEIVSELGLVIDEEQDTIEYDGKILSQPSEYTYVVLNKPSDVITAVDDKYRRKTVVELVEIAKRIYPVGRLDYNTTGVLLLTDDGDLTNKLLHPRFKASKIYTVLLDKRLRPVDLHHLQKGIEIEDYKTQPCKIREIRAIDNCSFLEIELREGRKRQIRLMFEQLNYVVEKLDRISFAGITYKGLKQGQWRYLTDKEVERLKQVD